MPGTVGGHSMPSASMGVIVIIVSVCGANGLQNGVRMPRQERRDLLHPFFLKH